MNRRRRTPTAGTGADPDWETAGPVKALMREAAVSALVAAAGRGEPVSTQVALLAEVFGVHERTVWTWKKIAEETGRTGRLARSRFEFTDEMRARYAEHRANCADLHRELVKEAEATGAWVPALSTLQRAARHDMTAGQRAGLRGGERARRAFDVRFQRPEVFRNEVWEGDHKQAPVFIDVEGEPVKPWVTWFIDCGTCVICGVAVTPGYPSREAVLAALRASISRDTPFGPFGGLPGMIRIDRGKDFLSNAVGSSMAYFGVEVGDLPGYSPWLKGRVEALNGAAVKMLFARMPHFTGEQKQVNGRPYDPDAPPLRFEAFVAKVLEFVEDWNTRWPKDALDKRTPAQAWSADATPIVDVPGKHLVLYTMEDGDTRVVDTKGVRFGNLRYVGPCLNGIDGTLVRVRWMPNHPEIIEIFKADTLEYLGPAVPSDAAGPEVQHAVRAVQKADAKQLRKDLKAAAQRSRLKWASATTAGPPQTLGLVSDAQAQAELERRRGPRPLSATPRPFPRRPPAPGWAIPGIPGTAATDQGMRDDEPA